MVKREELFSKALKVEAEEIKAELLCEVRELTDVVLMSLREEVGSENLDLLFLEFYEIVEKEAKERKWDLRYFRNGKNEPVTNLFKKVIRNICKERNLQLSNDSLSRILNVVRKMYGDEGVLFAGLFPAEAFRKREYYGIPYDLGDTNSCFRDGGCNEGNVLWLIKEDRKYDRAKLVVFHYQNGSKVGVGRCWVYKVSPYAIYVTNFYSKGVELKDERYKYTIVRLLRKLFDLSENVKFRMRTPDMPIYLNGDGIVIYEPAHYENSDQVLDALENLWSTCLWCGAEERVKDLKKYDERIYYSPASDDVSGLIVCSDCLYDLENMVECADCGELISRDDATFIDGVGFVCDRCYEDGYFFCERCERVYRRDYAVFTPDNRVLCEDCALEVGARCSVCGEFFYFDKEEEDEVTVQEYQILYRSWRHEEYICDRCAERHMRVYQCEQCGREVRYLIRDYLVSSELRNIVRLGICSFCYYDREKAFIESAFEGKDHASLFAKNENVVDPAEQVLREILSE